MNSLYINIRETGGVITPGISPMLMYMISGDLSFFYKSILTYRSCDII